jgi:addiction module HigA family antidote
LTAYDSLCYTYVVSERLVQLRTVDGETGVMAEAEAIRMKNPVHPGGFVKAEIIEPLRLSVTDAAQALGITRAALSAFLNERTSLSPDMAIRIEKAFGVSMETLMRMQNSLDIAQARKREGEIMVARYVAKTHDEPQPKTFLKEVP